MVEEIWRDIEWKRIERNVIIETEWSQWIMYVFRWKGGIDDKGEQEDKEIDGIIERGDEENERIDWSDGRIEEIGGRDIWWYQII